MSVDCNTATIASAATLPRRPTTPHRTRLRHMTLLRASEQLGHGRQPLHPALGSPCTDDATTTPPLASFLAAAQRFLRYGEGGVRGTPRAASSLTSAFDNSTHHPRPPPRRERRPMSASPYAAPSRVSPTATLTPPNLAKRFVRRLHTRDAVHAGCGRPCDAEAATRPRLARPPCHPNVVDARESKPGRRDVRAASLAALPSSWCGTPRDTAGADGVRAACGQPTVSPTPEPSGAIDVIVAQALECVRVDDVAGALGLYSRALHMALPTWPAARTARLCCRRAALYIATFHYSAAVVDCKWVLRTMPHDVEANWYAARALLYANRLSEARRHYQAARRQCLVDDADALTRLGGVGRGRHDARPAAVAIAMEEALVTTLEGYARDLRAGLWSRASAAMASVMEVLGPDAAAEAPWRVRQLAAELYVDPGPARSAAQRLLDTHPGLVELYGVLARAVFYHAHDAAATTQSLQLLQRGHDVVARQNTQLRDNVECYLDALGATDAAAAEQAAVREWSAYYRVADAVGGAQLQQSIEAFARHRDAGNAAYAAGRWGDAFDAYSRCLHVDLHNHSLLAAAYCNRAAVLMQTERWHEALLDAHKAIRFGPNNAKARLRRARIYLRLFHASATASPVARELRLRYVDAALVDFTEALALAPSAAVQRELWQARQLRGQFLSSAARQTEWAGSERRTASDVGLDTAGCSAEVRRWFGVLGVAPGTVLDERGLTKVYKAAALRWHPDKWVSATSAERGAAERTFKEVNVAYHSLKAYLAERAA